MEISKASNLHCRRAQIHAKNVHFALQVSLFFGFENYQRVRVKEVVHFAPKITPIQVKYFGQVQTEVSPRLIQKGRKYSFILWFRGIGNYLSNSQEILNRDCRNRNPGPTKEIRLSSVWSHLEKAYNVMHVVLIQQIPPFF